MKHSTRKILLIVGIIIFAIISIYVIMSIVNSKGEILYSTTYSFGFGTRRIKIYENGAVYDDIELEDPNHKPDYKYLRTLTKDDVDNLAYRLKNDANNESIKEYVIQLVYGVNEFDDFGNY